MTDVSISRTNNMTSVSVGSLTLWFSYDTCVAFCNNHVGELVVSENVWSQTTGKHLNWIDSDKKKRVPHEEFTARLKRLTDQITVPS